MFPFQMLCQFSQLSKLYQSHYSPFVFWPLTLNFRMYLIAVGHHTSEITKLTAIITAPKILSKAGEQTN